MCVCELSFLIELKFDSMWSPFSCLSIALNQVFTDLVTFCKSYYNGLSKYMNDRLPPSLAFTNALCFTLSDITHHAHIHTVKIQIVSQVFNQALSFSDIPS